MQFMNSPAQTMDFSARQRENRQMTIDDLSRLVATALSTNEKQVKIDEVRILVALFLQLLAPRRRSAQVHAGPPLW